MLRLAKGTVIYENYLETDNNNVKGFFLSDLTEYVSEINEDLKSKELEYLILKRGCYNGYVALTKNHPYYGKDYDEFDVEVHGGLTFSEEIEYKGEKYWVVGFDTAHADDTAEYWTKERTFEETLDLYNQLVILGDKHD